MAPKRRTGYARSDSTPRGPKHWPKHKHVDRVKRDEAGTIRAQLVGKLGRRRADEMLERLYQRVGIGGRP